MHAIVLLFRWSHNQQRVVNEHDRRLVLFRLGFEPVEMLFAQAAGTLAVLRGAGRPGLTEEVNQVDAELIRRACRCLRAWQGGGGA